MKLPGVTTKNPITGADEQAFKCVACEGVFVGFQMEGKRTYCRKCAATIAKPKNANRRERKFAGIWSRNMPPGFHHD